MPGGSIGKTIKGVINSATGSTQADAAREGGKILARSADEARAETNRLLNPYIELGTDVTERLSDSLTNPTTRSDIVNNDLFKELFENATRTITNRNASRGKLYSGNTLTDLTNASLGIGSQLYQQDLNNLFQAAGLGSNAATNAAGINTNLITGKGGAMAASKIGQAAAYGQGLNNLINIGKQVAGAGGAPGSQYGNWIGV